MFLWASALWPFGAYYHRRNNNTWSAIVACIPLWVASLAAILMIGGTFEAKASAVPTAGVLVFGTIVVLADGVGWAALCIKTTTVNPADLVKPNLDGALGWPTKPKHPSKASEFVSERERKPGAQEATFAAPA